MQNIKDIMAIGPEIPGRQGIFKGTYVPFERLFGYSEESISPDKFLTDVGTVTREQAKSVIEAAGRPLSSKNIHEFYAYGV